jgi:preprotein translocase subunit SecD
MKKNLMPRAILIASVTAIALIMLIPTFLGYGTVSKEELESGQKANRDSINLGFTKLEPINLGLDLQGGMHVVLGVQTGKAIRDELEHTVEVYQDEFNEQKILFTKIEVTDDNLIEMIFGSPADAERARTIVGKRQDYKISRFGDQGLRMQMEDRAIANQESMAIRQAKETIERRVDEFNVREPQIYTQQDFATGETQIVVRLPGIVDPARAKRLIGKTAILEFKLVEKTEYVASSEERLIEQAGGTIPSGYAVYKDKSGLQFYLLRKKADVPGKYLTDARVSYDESQMSAVSFTWNSEGAKLFGKITGPNVGKLLAAVIDDIVITAPRINGRITREGQITGSFSNVEAQDLAIQLRSGSLPVPVEIEEERTVGPTLGKDSIDKGRFSLMIGGLCVLIFMVAYYRKSGLIADLALMLNIVFLLGALAMFGATLTLPGIAGIVLTIGMAVDANVIIFERIREELRLGKPPRVAVDSGYSKAMWTILDANITTAIAAVVLFQFGTGPIKGFAVTLSIGIVTSIFTALVVTRTVFDYIVSRRGRMQSLSI